MVSESVWTVFPNYILVSNDILNPVYSNIMHFTRITVGNKKRTESNLLMYHDKIVSRIKQFIDHEEIHYTTSHLQN